jgi:TPR repeat protein
MGSPDSPQLAPLALADPAASKGLRRWGRSNVVHMLSSTAYKLAAVLVTASVGNAWAIGPSFDCSKASAPLPQYICASPDLSRTDLEFAQAYYALRQQVGPAGSQALKLEAVDFQNRVAQQCGIDRSGALPPDSGALAACLQRGYAEQRSVWLSRLTGAAMEEASRPVEEQVALQRDLQASSLLPPTATIDGVYGAATRTAILTWQHSRRLPETGFIGDDMARALKDAARRSGLAPGIKSFTGSRTNQNSTSPDRVAADKRAETLAYDAAKEDTGALDVLRTEAEAGSPSALYGLSKYYFLQRAKNGPTLFTGLIDDHLIQVDPSFRETLDKTQHYKNDREHADDAEMRRWIALLGSAVQLGDPAAQAGLATEYWAEVARWTALLSTVAKFGHRIDFAYDINWIHTNHQGIEALQAFKWACDKAKSLLSLSMQQSWPDAFLQYGVFFVYQTPPPLPPLLSESGCMVSNPTYSDQLLNRAAELGSADGRHMLREKYIEEGRSADAALWDGRLRQLANEGNREAQDLLPLHNK